MGGAQSFICTACFRCSPFFARRIVYLHRMLHQLNGKHLAKLDFGSLWEIVLHAVDCMAAQNSAPGTGKSMSNDVDGSRTVRVER
jgi:hypothetical protein